MLSQNSVPWGAADMKILTATIASLAVAAGLVAPAPARADNDDLAKAILGIAAIAIIANAIDDRNDRKASSTLRAGRLGSVDRYDRYRDDDGIYRHGKRRGPKARRGYKKHALPRSCLREVETRRGDRLFYGSRCLNRNFRFASKLPDHCETLVRTRRGFRSFFAARCLRRDGWRVARR